MAYLYDEIRYATWLVRTDKYARDAGVYDGQIAPSVKAKIKAFLVNCKKMFQSFNKDLNSKHLYIKSIFFDGEKDCLIIYTRLNGKDTAIKIVNQGRAYVIKNATTGAPIREDIRRFLTGICEYWIPSEDSFYNHKAINLMPQWRLNPNAA